jgi:hypothetical protein
MAFEQSVPFSRFFAPKDRKKRPKTQPHQRQLPKDVETTIAAMHFNRSHPPPHPLNTFDDLFGNWHIEDEKPEPLRKKRGWVEVRTLVYYMKL